MLYAQRNKAPWTKAFSNNVYYYCMPLNNDTEFWFYQSTKIYLLAWGRSALKKEHK